MEADRPGPLKRKAIPVPITQSYHSDNDYHKLDRDPFDGGDPAKWNALMDQLRQPHNSLTDCKDCGSVCGCDCHKASVGL